MEKDFLEDVAPRISPHGYRRHGDYSSDRPEMADE